MKTIDLLMRELCRNGSIKMIPLIVLVIMVNMNVYAQPDSLTHSSGKIHIGLGPGKVPSIVLRMDTIFVGIDTTETSKLNPIWIKRIKILKDYKYKHLYSSPESDAAILITIKRKYIPKTKEVLGI